MSAVLRTAAPSPFAYFASATLKAFNTNKTSWIGLAVFLIVVVAAILAPVLAPFDPNDQNILEKLRAPTFEHWLGPTVSAATPYRAWSMERAFR